MSDIERYQGETLLDELKQVEEAGLLYVKGYNYAEISTLLSLSVDKTKSYIKEYKKMYANVKGRLEAENKKYKGTLKVIAPTDQGIVK